MSNDQLKWDKQAIMEIAICVKCPCLRLQVENGGKIFV